MYDPYERCRRSLERAQAEWDAMQPPGFYDEEPDFDELDYIENARIEAAERERDES